jgi:hypothetical protein
MTSEHSDKMQIKLNVVRIHEKEVADAKGMKVIVLE